jgi:hypothetical protein
MRLSVFVHDRAHDGASRLDHRVGADKSSYTAILADADAVTNEGSVSDPRPGRDARTRPDPAIVADHDILPEMNALIEGDEILDDAAGFDGNFRQAAASTDAKLQRLFRRGTQRHEFTNSGRGMDDGASTQANRR